MAYRMKHPIIPTLYVLQQKKAAAFKHFVFRAIKSLVIAAPPAPLLNFSSSEREYCHYGLPAHQGWKKEPRNVWLGGSSTSKWLSLIRKDGSEFLFWLLLGFLLRPTCGAKKWKRRFGFGIEQQPRFCQGSVYKSPTAAKIAKKNNIGQRLTTYTKSAYLDTTTTTIYCSLRILCAAGKSIRRLSKLEEIIEEVVFSSQSPLIRFRD